MKKINEMFNEQKAKFEQKREERKVKREENKANNPGGKKEVIKTIVIVAETVGLAAIATAKILAHANEINAEINQDMFDSADEMESIDPNEEIPEDTWVTL